MKVFFKLVLIVASLMVFACDKTENEEELVNFFFGNYLPDNEERPITIKGLDFGNQNQDGTVINDFGSALNSGQMRYLVFSILYDCNTDEQESITLYCKIINSDGSLKAGQSSPEGYTYSHTFTSAGSNSKDVYQELGGWGNSSQSTYPAGIYRVEFWFTEGRAVKAFEKAVQIR